MRDGNYNYLLEKTNSDCSVSEKRESQGNFKTTPSSIVLSRLPLKQETNKLIRTDYLLCVYKQKDKKRWYL